MKIITGKQSYQKTKNKMKESLKQPGGVWIVPASLVDEYERMLIELSPTRTLLMHRVMTFERIRDEALNKQEMFRYSILTRTQAYMFIYDLLTKHQGSMLSRINMGTIDELWTIFQTFNKQKVTKLNVKDLDLADFSKMKLEECFSLFQQFQQILGEKQLLFNEDLSFIDNLNEPIYVDGFNSLTMQQIDFLKNQEDVSVLLCFDKQEDSYTNGIKQLAHKLGGEQISFNKELSDYEAYFMESYQNLKAIPYEKEHSFYYSKAINQNVEIKHVAVSIYKQLLQGVKPKQIGILIQDFSLLPQIQNEFLNHDLVLNYANSLTMNYHPVYQLMKYLFAYMQKQDLSYLLKIERTGLLKNALPYALIIQLEKQWISQGMISYEGMLEKKKEYDFFVQRFTQGDTLSEKSQVLEEYLISGEIMTKAYLEEIGSVISSLMHFLEEFKHPIEIDNKMYSELFFKLWQVTKPKENEDQDGIDLFSIDEFLSTKDYYYILGCNEGSFPMIPSDHGFLLQDERLRLQNNGMDLGEDLFIQIESQYLQWYKLFSLGATYYLSYPTGTLNGDDLLASSLYLALKRLFARKETVVSFKRHDQDITTFNASKDLLYHYDQEELFPLHQLVENYTSSRNQPKPINKEDYLQLIQKDQRNLTSISELETYNGCPFKYFLRYGLKIYPWQEQKLKANDFGTLVHDLLDFFSDLIGGNKTIDQYLVDMGIEDVERDYQQFIYKQISHHELNLEDQTLFVLIYHFASQKMQNRTFSSSGNYFFNKLLHDVFNTIKILLYQASISNFKLSSHEQWSERSHEDVKVQGRVDRANQFKDYIMVNDYKSSDKALDLCLATLGFNMQMLVYLDMLSIDTQKELGGVLYFNTKQRIVKCEHYHLDEALKASDIINSYKQEGYIVSDEEVLQNLDIANDPSVIANYKYVKSKKGYSGNLLNKEAFKELIRLVNERVDQIIDEIYHQANIAIEPSHSKDANINQLVNPCTYCDYAHICLKDAFYNENREIEYIVKKEMLERLGGDEDD